MRCLSLSLGLALLVSTSADAQVLRPCPQSTPAAVARPVMTAAGQSRQRTVARPATQKTLYERLGGEKAITAVVDDFVVRAAPNEKINFFRKGTAREWKPNEQQLAAVKKHLVNLIAMLTGGPQKYTGKDMKTAHAGMRISNAEFDAAAADLKASLDHFKVPMNEQQELLTLVASTRNDIVEKPLYDRLGGDSAIRAVVDDFVIRAASNQKINFFRKGTGREWQPSERQVRVLKEHLVDLVGELTGGPHVYTGRDMKSTHAGMQISSAEFDALAGDLKASLDHFKVPAKEQSELLAIVGSTRPDIVEK
jgi:truncated hemoglobin YjbI